MSVFTPSPVPMSNNSVSNSTPSSNPTPDPAPIADCQTGLRLCEDEVVTFLLIVGVTFFVLYTVYWLLNNSIKIIKHSQVMLVERFGRYHRTLTPGIRFLIPFVETPRELHWRYTRQVGNEKQIVDMLTDRVNLREHVLDFGKQSVITMDTVEFEIDALVYFRVVDPRIAVYRVLNLPDAVELLTQASLRNVIAKMSLDDTFSSREKMNKDLLAVVSKDALRWGIVITVSDFQSSRTPFVHTKIDFTFSNVDFFITRTYTPTS